MRLTTSSYPLWLATLFIATLTVYLHVAYGYYANLAGNNLTSRCIFLLIATFFSALGLILPQWFIRGLIYAPAFSRGWFHLSRSQLLPDRQISHKGIVIALTGGYLFFIFTALTILALADVFANGYAAMTASFYGVMAVRFCDWILAGAWTALIGVEAGILLAMIQRLCVILDHYRRDDYHEEDALLCSLVGGVALGLMAINFAARLLNPVILFYGALLMLLAAAFITAGRWSSSPRDLYRPYRSSPAQLDRAIHATLRRRILCLIILILTATQTIITLYLLRLAFPYLAFKYDLFLMVGGMTFGIFIHSWLKSRYPQTHAAHLTTILLTLVIAGIIFLAFLAQYWRDAPIARYQGFPYLVLSIMVLMAVMAGGLLNWSKERIKSDAASNAVGWALWYCVATLALWLGLVFAQLLLRHVGSLLGYIHVLLFFAALATLYVIYQQKINPYFQAVSVTLGFLIIGVAALIAIKAAPYWLRIPPGQSCTIYENLVCPRWSCPGDSQRPSRRGRLPYTSNPMSMALSSQNVLSVIDFHRALLVGHELVPLRISLPPNKQLDVLIPPTFVYDKPLSWSTDDSIALHYYWPTLWAHASHQQYDLIWVRYYIDEMGLYPQDATIANALESHCLHAEGILMIELLDGRASASSNPIKRFDQPFSALQSTFALHQHIDGPISSQHGSYLWVLSRNPLKKNKIRQIVLSSSPKSF